MENRIGMTKIKDLIDHAENMNSDTGNLQVEVLSQDYPVDNLSLKKIAGQVIDGDYSGVTTVELQRLFLPLD